MSPELFRFCIRKHSLPEPRIQTLPAKCGRLMQRDADKRFESTMDIHIRRLIEYAVRKKVSVIEEPCAFEHDLAKTRT